MSNNTNSWTSTKMVSSSGRVGEGRRRKTKGSSKEEEGHHSWESGATEDDETRDAVHEVDLCRDLIRLCINSAIHVEPAPFLASPAVRIDVGFCWLVATGVCELVAAFGVTRFSLEIREALWQTMKQQ